MSAYGRITIHGQPALTSAVRALVRAAVNQRTPSFSLKSAANEVLDALGHELSTKKRRKGDEEAA